MACALCVLQVLLERKGLLCSASKSGEVAVWDMALGDVVATAECGGDVNNVDSHPDGLVAVAGPGKQSTVWAMQPGYDMERRLRVECEGGVLGLHLSRAVPPLEPVLVTGDTSGAASVWAIPSTRLAAAESPVALKKRLQGRGQDSDEVIERRLREAAEECRHVAEYDYLVVNDDFERALDELLVVFRAQRQCLSRQSQRHETLLRALSLADQ